MESINDLDKLETKEHRQQFLLNLICFAGCVEGMFFFAAFAYVYFLRSRGLLSGLSSGTNWVFRDESAHMAFAFSTIEQIRKEEPELFDKELERKVIQMFDEALEVEMVFAQDTLSLGVAGLSQKDMRTYLEFVADQRLAVLGIAPVYHSQNPFHFMNLQDVQELTNFFERRVSAYQVGVSGSVSFEEEF